MKKFSDKTKEMAGRIAHFYLLKNNGDYSAANAEIEKLKIQDIKVFENLVTIYLCRPGLLIGRRGENLYKLMEFLGCKIDIHEENCLTDFMYVYDEADYL